MTSTTAYSDLQKETASDTIKAIEKTALLHATPTLAADGFQELDIKVSDVYIDINLGHGAKLCLIPNAITHIFNEGGSTRVRIDCDGFGSVDFITHTGGKLSMEMQGEGCLVAEIPELTKFL